MNENMRNLGGSLFKRIKTWNGGSIPSECNFLNANSTSIYRFLKLSLNLNQSNFHCLNQ